GELVSLAVAAVADLDGLVKQRLVAPLAAAAGVDVVALALADVQLAGPPDLDAALLQHLLPPVGQPADAAGDGEQDGVEVEREAHGLVDEARVEVDVGVQVALRHELALAGVPGELEGRVEELVAAGDGEDLVGQLADGGGARVDVLVDAVAEADEHALPLLDLLHKGRHVLGAANLHEHADGALAGAAVAGAVQRGAAGRDDAVGVDEARADLQHRGRGAVDLVVGVDDEEGVEGALQHGVRLVLVAAQVVEQVQEVARVAEALGGAVEGTALAHAVRGGGQGGGLADDAEDLLVEHPEGVHVARGGVGVQLLALQTRVRLRGEGAERGEGGLQHGHGVGVVAEGLEHALDVAVDVGVVHDLVLPAAVLGRGGQLAVDEQEGRLEEVGLVDELLDGVAAVAEDALEAVDVGDVALDDGGVHVGRVVDAEALVRLILGAVVAAGRLDLLDVRRQDRVVLDGELVRAAGAVVHDGERLARRAGGAASRVFGHDPTKAEGSALVLVKIDVTAASDAAAAVSSLQRDHGIAAVDVVIANAGVGSPISRTIDIVPETALQLFAVNAVGPVTLVNAAAALLRASAREGGPVFMAVSSSLGSIGAQAAIYEAFSASFAPYGATKSALNWFVHRLHLEEPWLTSFACHPGVVRTDMNSSMDDDVLESIGAISVEESVGSMMALLDTASRKTTGGSFRSYDGSTLPW
ncbi:Norsolorinic acid ketoreductase, partial [Colletotrichum tanaceti]